MRKHLTLTLLAMLAIGLGAQAQDTLTVAEGPEMMESVPLSHNFPDGQQHTQMIYPAEMLQELEGSSVSAMIFHLMVPTTIYNGSPTTVRLGSTTQTTFAATNASAFLPTDGMTIVFDDTVYTVDSTLTIVFSEPYVYSGGNLLIDFFYDGAGPMYGMGGHFYGVGTGQRTSLMMYYYPEYEESDVYGPFALPTVSFVYGEGGDACLPPTGLAATNITPHTADISWTPRSETQAFIVSLNGEVVDEGGSTAAYSATGLDPETEYTVELQAVCENGDSSAAVVVTFTTGVACPAPTALTADNIATTSVAIHWNGNPDDANQLWTIVVDGETVEEAWSDTTYTVTNLAHSHNHTIRVMAYCGDEGYSQPADITVATLCADIAEAPYVIDFEDNYMGCWTVESGEWAVATATGNALAHGGTHMLRNGIAFHAAGNYVDDPCTIRMQNIAVPAVADGLHLTWYAAGQNNYLSESIPCTYEVLVSIASLGIVDSVVLRDTLAISNDYRQNTLDLASYSGMTISIAFRHTTDSVSGVRTYLMLDDLRLQSDQEPEPTIGHYTYRYGSPDACVEVGETATFDAWLANGSDEGLSYEWTSTMADAGYATLSTVDGRLTVVYDMAGRDTITVTANNNYGTASATLYVNVETRTLAQLPLQAGFNVTQTYAQQFAQWCNVNLDGTGTSSFRLFTPAHTGIYAVGSYALPDSGQTDAMLVSPAIAVPAETEHMSLLYYVNASSTDETPATYEVLVSTSGRSSYLYFTDTVLRDTVLPGNQYTPRSVPLTGYAGDTVYLAFRHTSRGAQSLAIDEIEIREAFEPVVALASHPNNVEIGDTLVLSAVLANGQGDSTGYHWTSTKLSAGQADTTMLADSVMAIVYTSAGTDHVSVIATNAYGSASANAYITVNNPAGTPTVVITGPNSVSAGIEATFVAVQQAGDTTSVSYTWNSTMSAAGLATMSADGNQLTITYAESGTDHLSVTIDNGIGTMTNSVDIDVLPAPCFTPTGFTTLGADTASVSFSWTPGGSEAEWEVAIDGTVASVSMPQYTATGLQADTEYFVSVRAICGESDTSEALVGLVYTAEIEPTPEPGDTTGIVAAENVSFRLYPNPASDAVTISLDDEAVVTAIDASGRVVFSAATGDRQLTLDVSGLAKGAYFVRVTTASGTAVRKLIVR